MKKILLITLSLMLLAPIKANAFSWGDFFRNLFGFSSASTTTDIETVKKEADAELETILKNSDAAFADAQTAFVSIVSMLSPEKNAKEITTKLTAANALTKRAEQYETIDAIYSDYSTYLKENKVTTLVIIKTLTEEDKTKLVNNIATFSASNQTYNKLIKQLATLTNDVTKKAASSAERTEILNEINTASTLLTNNSTVLTTLTAQIKILGSLTGLKF